jgi:subtilisin family serine protease
VRYHWYLAAASVALFGFTSPPVQSAESAVTPASAQRSPAPRRIARPKRNSNEYRLSWGLAAINANLAYARGTNGEGVVVALIDTGLSGVPTELFGSVSSASTDLIATRKFGADNAEHGEQTAGLLAAALDGSGTVGVAYGATLLAIRVDIDGSCNTQCAVRADDLARGIDYAVAHGAKIIGVPLVGANRLRTVEPALARAAAAGVVIVAAAGNDAAAAPSWPARYAADPRFARAMIVAGATTPEGRAAAWSSKAKGAETRFIGAPGENVVVDCGEKFCRLASGTSYSVAYVAGAISLIMAANRDLTAPEAAEIILAGAADQGPRGVDAVTGTGRLDVSRALKVAARPSNEPGA